MWQDGIVRKQILPVVWRQVCRHRKWLRMRYWTTSEVETLVESYQFYGPSWDGWGLVLPGRTHRAIREKAYALGLKCEHPTAFRHYGGAPDLSAALAVASLDDVTRLRLALMFEEAVP
jgi:hypothetical protein